MIRNLKILGLALGAVFAMSAMLASAASAGQITGASSPVKLAGASTVGEKGVLTYNASQELVCDEIYHFGRRTTFAETGGSETHAPVPLPISEVTFVITYSGCEARINGAKVGTATVTMNGCDYDGLISSGITLPYGTSLRCPSGHKFVVHVYSNESHTTNICTYELGETGNQNRAGAFLQEAGEGKLTLGGTTTGISVSRTGILCGGTGSTTTATFSRHVIISGTNEGGEAVALSLS